MADAKDPAVEPIETRTKQKVVTVVSYLDDVIGVETFWYNDRRHCVGIPFGSLRACAQTPSFYSRTHGARQPVMAGRGGLQTLLVCAGVRRAAPPPHPHHRRG